MHNTDACAAEAAEVEAVRALRRWLPNASNRCVVIFVGLLRDSDIAYRIYSRLFSDTMRRAERGCFNDGCRGIGIERLVSGAALASVSRSCLSFREVRSCSSP